MSEATGKAVQKYRQRHDGEKNAVEEFLVNVISLEKELRKSLETPVPIKMVEPVDWNKYNTAENAIYATKISS